jgi:WD40 repeat protein/uncharacterized caspase-like protein
MLLVGVNQYQEPSLPTLRYPALDCQGLSDALTVATQAFPKKEVRIHHDFADRPPTGANVRASLQYITQAAQPQDTVLIYFSGHGTLGANNQQAVLCLADTQQESLLQTGLPLQELLQHLSNCAAHQQLVWLDACHSGGMTLKGARSKTDPAPLLNPTSQLIEVLRQRAAQSKGFYALLSCDQNQQSWEFPELGHGVFTYYLMHGLRGEAIDAQGLIEADTLYKYVYHQTLQYIDKTNQQIRLVNQQKSSRGDRQLQSEFPLQTPKRIVEGVGELVLGVRSPTVPSFSLRRALVVEGIPSGQETLSLGKVLRSSGGFELEYFPRPGKAWSEIRQAILDCLGCQSEADGNDQATPRDIETWNSKDRERSTNFFSASLPQATTTALLYLRGRVEETPDGEAWLVLGDGVQLSRSWLRQVLRQSRMAQQILLFDCPGATSLSTWVEDLQIGSDRGQCIIAAASPIAQSEQFTQALLETLQQTDPQAGLPIAAWIAQLQVYLAGTATEPQVWLSGSQGVIEVLPGRMGAKAAKPFEELDLGLCPYMGLRAFAEENAQYFYGRESLTQTLVDELRHRSCLAVVGASGSGKSSVVQAGLMTQLRQGKQLPGSQHWWIGCFQPGAEPVKSLSRRLVDPGTEKERAYQQLQIEGLLYQGVEGLVQWLRSRPEPLVVFVIDQFEELFTLAAPIDRDRFLELLIGAVTYASDRFKLVLTLRADFIAPCLEIPELAKILQQSSVLVPPYLTEESYRQAIVHPAEQVGLQIESGLAEVLLSELNHSAGDLPLLQFVLEQLWQQRQGSKLTLQSYQQIGGLKGALERQAQAAYDSLDPEAQACAQWIFLTLTQLGEGTEDTRRRVLKSSLVVAKYPAPLVERTLQVLTAAKLLVVNLEEESISGQGISGQSRGENQQSQNEEKQGNRQQGTEIQSASALPSSPSSLSAADITIEVAHEILIRHWSTLRWWLDENRARLHLQRQLEQSAQLWMQRGQQPDFLLRGVRLAEAEELYVKYTDELSEPVQRFIEACLEARQQEQRQAQQRLRRAQIAAALIGALGLVALGLGGLAYKQKLTAQIENIAALDASSEALLWSNQQLESLLSGVKAAQQFQQIGGLGKWLIGAPTWTDTQTIVTSTMQQALYNTQERNRLEHHTQQVNAVSFSPSGQFLASASDDKTIALWRRDGSLLNTLTAHDDRVTSVAFSPDGNTIASASADKTIKLWGFDPATGDVKLQQSLVGHQDWVTSVAFSPDGRTIVSASRDRTLKLWRLDGTLIKTLAGHQGWVNQVSFGSNGQIASASEDKTIRIWRQDGVLIRILNGSGDRVTSVAFSPDNQRLVSASGHAVRVWNLANGTSQVLPSGQTQSALVNGVRFSPDGQTIAAASANGRIDFWNRAGLLQQTFEGHGGEISSIQFSPDGSQLASASADKTIRLWKTGNNQPLQQGGSIYSAQWSPSLPTIPEGDRTFATAGWNGTIEIWHTVQNTPSRLVRRLQAHKSTVSEIQFSPDDRLLASAGWDNQAKLWRVSDGALLTTFTGHRDGVTRIAFNPKGQTIATGSNDKTIKLWQLDGWLQTTLTGHTDGITSITFSPDGQTLASGSYDNTLKLWRLDGTLLQTIDQPSAVASIRFNPEGTVLAVARWDNTIQLWRVKDQHIGATPFRSFVGHQGGVVSLDFSANGRTLASSSADGTIKLWSMADGTLLKTLLGHRSRINSVEFSADDRKLISGDEAGNVIVWDLNLPNLLQQGCEQLHDYLKTNPRLKESDRQICNP